ncbi:hypothetical protein AB6A40_010206 [Gnathostoma spinigerum]|uniref:Leucine Rich repeat-containing domain protein n=1 Tax=Gnathostoma spinigerum TaxID=75299 RepID=A0ABD6F2A0_9BILA
MKFSVNLDGIQRTMVDLNLANNHLQSIGKDIMRNFDKLQTLDISGNGLMEIQASSFVDCPNLKILNLAHNHLRNLRKGTFANQISYEELDISFNNIARLDSETFGNDNVLHLDLSGNELKTIPRHALSSIRNSITKLILRQNKIRSIEAVDFAGMSNLTELELADNYIETIDESAFSMMPKLESLDLSHNPIISWDPRAFKELSPSMQMLNLADTGLYSLPKITNRDIRHFNISHNKIRELNPNDLGNYHKLVTFDISFNEVGDLSPKLFEILVALKHLNISGNPIEILTENHMKPLYYTLRSLFTFIAPMLCASTALHYQCLHSSKTTMR